MLGHAIDGSAIEPLAADARREGDGRDRAFLKLVAGLLGIGYDALARREAQRRQRKWVVAAAASLAGMAIALGLAVTAYVARNDAQRRQAQAEDILGFMLGDLRKKLATVGRLDLMRAVDDKAMTYFATLNPRDLSDRALEEQARSLTGIGEVRLNEGKHDAAMAAFREAHARSTALHQRAPDNGQRLFDLAQAEYWIGSVALEQGRHDESGVWFRKYRDSGIRLAAMDRKNFAWQREVAYGHQTLAVLDERRGRYPEAERAFREELALYEAWVRRRPHDLELRFEAANIASWLGSLSLQQGRLANAEAFFVEQADAMRRIVAEDAQSAEWKEVWIDALLLLADVQAQRGRLSASRASVRPRPPWPSRCRRTIPATIPGGRHWAAAAGGRRSWIPQVQHPAGRGRRRCRLAARHRTRCRTQEREHTELAGARPQSAGATRTRARKPRRRAYEPVSGSGAARTCLAGPKERDLATVAGKDPPA